MARILIDECLPRRLAGVLAGFDVVTVPEAGWTGRSNGELLRLAEEEFDAFVTIDQNLQYQQNLQDAEVALVVLECRTNRFEDLLPLVPRLLDVLRDQPVQGGLIRIGV